MMTRRLGVAAALAAAAWACSETPTSPSHYAAFQQIDLREGTGAEAANTKLLVVHYTGWLYDSTQPDGKGAQFDSSVGRTPLTFALGAGQVIAGWDRGLVGMKVGGLRRLIIPPSLGYGGTRSGIIPPNATLVFDIELLDVL